MGSSIHPTPCILISEASGRAAVHFSPTVITSSLISEGKVHLSHTPAFRYCSYRRQAEGNFPRLGFPLVITQLTILFLGEGGDRCRVIYENYRYLSGRGCSDVINARSGERAPRAGNLRRVTDNVIREKGKARGPRTPARPKVSVTCLMDSTERVITAARGGARGEPVTFFPRRASSRSAVGLGRFIHSCEMCTRVVARRPPRKLVLAPRADIYVRTWAGSQPSVSCILIRFFAARSRYRMRDGAIMLFGRAFIIAFPRTRSYGGLLYHNAGGKGRIRAC